MQNLSIGVNVVYEGSPSRILKVLLISLGITILPRSSTRLTIPVAFIVYLSPLQMWNTDSHGRIRSLGMTKSTIAAAATENHCHCEPVRTLAWQSVPLQ